VVESLESEISGGTLSQLRGREARGEGSGGLFPRCRRRMPSGWGLNDTGWKVRLRRAEESEP